MKKIVLLFIFAILASPSCESEDYFVPGSGHLNIEKPETPDKEPDKDPEGEIPQADYSRLTEENHPRLILSDTDFGTIREQVNSRYKYITMMHEKIMILADSYSKQTTELTKQYDASNKRILTVSKNAFVRIIFCSYAYRYTGEKRFLERVEKDLLAVCAFDDWNAKKHFLDVGEMAAGVAFGYDWCYRDLAPGTKAACEKALKDLAFTPAQKKQTNLDFYNNDGNWNQVCNGGLVAGALAVFEKNPIQAKDIIEKAVKANPIVMAQYAPDGGYPEGASYWGYGTNYQNLMLTAMETCLGTDFGLSKQPGFEKTGNYRLFCYGATNSIFNYSDNMSTVGPEYPMWYLAWKFNKPSLLCKELEFIETNKFAAGGNEARFVPILMYYATRINLDKLAPPAEKIYVAGGKVPVVLIHTDWTGSETDKYVGMKGGQAMSSHSHMDNGSFVYDAYGIRWAMDYDRPSYQTLESAIKEAGGSLWDMNQSSERWKTFYYNNRRHNTLTINDSDHNVVASATISETFTGPEELGATIDLSSTFKGQAEEVTRTIKLIGEDLVITDKIYALDSKSAKIRWTMVTEAVPEITSSGITLTKAGKTMYLKTTVSGTRIQYKTWPSDPASYTYNELPYKDVEPHYEGTYIVGFEGTIDAGKYGMFKVTLSKTK